jgi:hypothetical protein
MRAAQRPAVLLLGSLALAACGPSPPDGTGTPAAAPTAAPAPAPAAAPAAAAPFDVTTVPLAPAPLPAFPYLDWPESVPVEAREVARQAALDAVTVIAGAQLITLEGQVEQRRFSIPPGSSPLEVRRYYRDRITALGGVAVSGLQPVGDAAVVVEAVRALFPPEADPAQRLDLQRYDEGDYQYEVYIARTAPAQAWFVVQTSRYSAVVTTVAVATP